MKVIIAVLLLSAQLLGVYAAQMQMGAAGAIRALNDLDLTSDYAKEFTTLVQLKLEQGSKVDEVLSMIKKLLDQLRQDQQ